jgi:hypothetical protein
LLLLFPCSCNALSHLGEGGLGLLGLVLDVPSDIAKGFLNLLRAITLTIENLLYCLG